MAEQTFTVELSAADLMVISASLLHSQTMFRRVIEASPEIADSGDAQVTLGGLHSVILKFSKIIGNTI